MAVAEEHDEDGSPDEVDHLINGGKKDHLIRGGEWLGNGGFEGFFSCYKFIEVPCSISFNSFLWLQSDSIWNCNWKALHANTSQNPVFKDIY